jgi:hypothetical protein
MRKIVSAKVESDGKISLDNFKSFLDITRVALYSCKEQNGRIILKFYDKNRRLIKMEQENGKNKEEK